MHIRITNEFKLIVCMWVILSAVILLAQSNALRIALGLPFALFIPGYCVVSTMSPRKGDMSAAERVSLSFGLSILAVPLLGIALAFTPFRLTANTIVITLTLLIVACSVGAWRRRSKLRFEDRFVLNLELPFARWGQSGRMDKGVGLFLGVSVAVALVSVVYAVAAPLNGERFTEFYLAGTSGKASGYPKKVAVGSDVAVTVGIANQEGRTTTYVVRVTEDGRELGTRWSSTLETGQSAQSEMTFRVARRGQQQVSFQLFRSGDEQAYRSTHLWVNGYGEEEAFTDVYANASNWDYRPGYQIPVDIVIFNHEREDAAYLLAIRQSWTGDTLGTYAYNNGAVIRVASGKTWRGQEAMLLEYPQGADQRVDFFLYRVGSETPIATYTLPLLSPVREWK